eukprot:s474_g11.t3
MGQTAPNKTLATQRPARLEQKIAALPSPLAVAKCACVRQLLEAARAGAMEAAIRRLLESTFGEFVEGMDRASASSFPMTLQDLNLKEKAIQEELDEDGNFPFDLTSGRIGQVTVSPGWMGNVEVVATGIVLNFTFSPMKAMNNAFRKDDPDEEEEQYMGVPQAPPPHPGVPMGGPPPPDVPPRFCQNHFTSAQREKIDPCQRPCERCGTQV